MKPNHLFTSMLALTTIVAVSCSAPRYAQHSNHDDDVYNSTARAQVFTPQVRPSSQSSQDAYNEDEYYGTSDQYYDMDYSSRINRFQYGSPWRSYYDPYFNNGYYGGSGFSLGLGFGSIWGSPNGWGLNYSPFWGNSPWGYDPWGYSPWGWNNYYGGFYGGGFYGGGFYGGGYYGGGFYGGGYYGGGYYTGRTTNVPRPGFGREGGVRTSNGYGRPGTRVADANGNYLSPRDRAASYRPNVDRYGNNNGVPDRSSRTRIDNNGRQDRPATRNEGYRPDNQQQTRPTYSPPPSRGGDMGGGGRSGGGGGGGGSRTSRGGRG